MMKIGDKVKIIGVSFSGANNYIGKEGVVKLIGEDIWVNHIKMKSGEKDNWFPESSLEKIEPEKLPKPSPEKPTQFKVGDEVEIVGYSNLGNDCGMGSKGVIESISPRSGDYWVSPIGLYIPASSLKLVTHKEPKFKVGDRVKRRTNGKVYIIKDVIPPMVDGYKHNHYHYMLENWSPAQDVEWLDPVEENRVDYPDKPGSMNPVPTFYCCYVDGTGGFAHKHDTEAEAMKEAERLAKQGQNHGKKVHVLKCIASCEVPETPVQWNFK
jgi:hypothetical protein